MISPVLFETSTTSVFVDGQNSSMKDCLKIRLCKNSRNRNLFELSSLTEDRKHSLAPVVFSLGINDLAIYFQTLKIICQRIENLLFILTLPSIPTESQDLEMESLADQFSYMSCESVESMDIDQS